MSRTASASKEKAAAETTAEKKTARKTAAAKPAAKKTTARKTKAAKPAEEALRILFVSSEVAPFAASGGLGEVAGSLPVCLNEKGCDVRVILPLYGTVKQEWRDRMTFLFNMFVRLSWRSQYCGVFELKDRGVTYYFLDNEFYFKRDKLYGYYDDGERFAFFSKAVLETLDRLDFGPHIIHCNDWQSALVPVYLRQYRDREKFAGMKTLFTIHNIAFQGMYDPYILGDLFGLPNSDLPLMKWGNSLNLMKAAVELSDKVNTVSPTYAKEIMDPWFSFGLDPLLREKQYKLCGILNGIDFQTYDPASPSLPAPFSADDLSGKAVCRSEVLRDFGLSEDDRPVIAMVGRLTAQKGLDLVKEVIYNVLDSGARVVMLGTGDAEFEQFFSSVGANRPDSFSLKLEYNPAVAKLMYAGSDLFLMPSKTEPCGLAQMMALRYGTLPIVRKTGGLNDSVKDCGDGQGCGFTFQNYDSGDMLDAIERAIALCRNREAKEEVVKRAMACDFSWYSAAEAYMGLYREMKDLW